MHFLPEVAAPWAPLTVEELSTVMRGASFFWCLAGGHAIERFIGRPYRAHDDIDIVVLRSEQLAGIRGWRLWKRDNCNEPSANHPQAV